MLPKPPGVAEPSRRDFSHTLQEFCTEQEILVAQAFLVDSDTKLEYRVIVRCKRAGKMLVNLDLDGCVVVGGIEDVQSARFGISY
jgi:hypothetical protein